MKPRLLDLFCGAGGCARGYVEAGFEVHGVDNRPQKRYLASGAASFVQADALDYFEAVGRNFDAVHASPPCQVFSAATRASATQSNHCDLIEPTRQLLLAIAKPWVMENVPGAPMAIGQTIMLCGTFFGLRVIRHRFFETSFPCLSPGRSCSHPPIGTVGRAGVRGKKIGDWISVAGSTDLKVASPAMGIDWMRNRKEISQAIPPAYTRFVGRQLLDYLAATTGHPDPAA